MSQRENMVSQKLQLFLLIKSVDRANNTFFCDFCDKKVASFHGLVKHLYRTIVFYINTVRTTLYMKAK